MSRHVFFTGFPGFIGRQLIGRLSRAEPEASFTFLIQDQVRPVAERSIAAIEAESEGFAERAKLVSGDITLPWLGMGEDVYRQEADRTTDVWHLAAVYDLSVPEPTAYRVNVVGTANILDLCEEAPNLSRLDYVSTCYVSGARTGLVRESELDEGQTFKNHYESTKAWAEMEVQRRMHRLPVCVHRPGIVVGDSHSGERDKNDCPYFIINLLLRLPKWLPMINIGEGGSRVNLVPVDFLCDGMASVWNNSDSLGHTIQWADPNPYAAKEIVDKLLQILGRRRAIGMVPSDAVERALGAERVREIAHVPKESVIYFNHDVIYDTENQHRFLEGTGLRCPDFLSYLPTLVEYVKEHPDKEFLDGRKV
jgi:thioester reductase-like protein